MSKVIPQVKNGPRSFRFPSLGFASFINYLARLYIGHHKHPVRACICPCVSSPVRLSISKLFRPKKVCTAADAIFFCFQFLLDSTFLLSPYLLCSRQQNERTDTMFIPQSLTLSSEHWSRREGVILCKSIMQELLAQLAHSHDSKSSHHPLY